MQFISVEFLYFFPLAFIIYFLTKREYRYLVLLIANYLFYGWNNLAAIPTLLLATSLTYLGGRLLEIKQNKRLYYGLFFSTTILILGVYKYTNFILENLNSLSALLGGTNHTFPNFSIIAPIGLSFFIFQSTSYLNDIYRKEMAAERNFLRYAAFVSFFPTVLSGPIQRSRDLLPQLKNHFC